MKLGNITATTESLGAEEVSELEYIEDQSSVTDTVSEADTAMTSIDNIDTAISDGESVVSGIEEMQKAVAEKADDISPTTQATVESFLDAINKHLGLTDTVATLESSNQTSLIATLEDKKEGILSKIVSGLKALLSSVVSFLAGLFRNKTLVSRSIEATTQQLNSVGSDTLGKCAVKGVGDAAAANALLDGVEDLVTVSNKAIAALEVAKKGASTSTETENAYNVADSVNVSDVAITDNRTLSIVTNRAIGTGGVVKVIVAENKTPVTERALTKREAAHLLGRARTALTAFEKMKKFEMYFTAMLKNIANFTRHVGREVKRMTNHGDPDSIKAKNDAEGTLLLIRGITMAFGGKIPGNIYRNITTVVKFVQTAIKGAVTPTATAGEAGA